MQIHKTSCCHKFIHLQTGDRLATQLFVSNKSNLLPKRTHWKWDKIIDIGKYRVFNLNWPNSNCRPPWTIIPQTCSMIRIFAFTKIGFSAANYLESKQNCTNIVDHFRAIPSRNHWSKSAAADFQLIRVVTAKFRLHFSKAEKCNWNFSNVIFQKCSFRLLFLV